MHVVGTDLIVQTKQDIDDMVKQQTWVGFRHQYGQKVRGQRTRSTGRTGADGRSHQEEDTGGAEEGRRAGASKEVIEWATPRR